MAGMTPERMIEREGKRQRRRALWEGCVLFVYSKCEAVLWGEWRPRCLFLTDRGWGLGFEVKVRVRPLGCRRKRVKSSSVLVTMVRNRRVCVLCLFACGEIARQHVCHRSRTRLLWSGTADGCLSNASVATPIHRLQQMLNADVRCNCSLPNSGDGGPAHGAKARVCVHLKADVAWRFVRRRLWRQVNVSQTYCYMR